MTDQELREQFEKYLGFEEIGLDFRIKNGEYESQLENWSWKSFLKGYSLAQETIAELELRLEQSVDISVVNELNETIKAKDAEIKKLRENFAFQKFEFIKNWPT